MKGGIIMDQSRWKSKVTWAGLAATVLLLAGQLGLYDVLNISQSWAQTVVDLLLSALAAFGILNNPTDSENF
jgi:uncharacterized membrane protein